MNEKRNESRRTRKRRESKRALESAIELWLGENIHNLPFDDFEITGRTTKFMADAAFAVLEGLADAFGDAADLGHMHWVDECPAAKGPVKREKRASD